MTLYSSKQKELDTNFIARYKSLKQEKEQEMAKRVAVQLSHTRKKLVKLGGPYLTHQIKRAINLNSAVNLGLQKQRVKFAILIKRMLTRPGLSVPFFFGISLTPAMRALVRRIMRKKIMMLLFVWRQMWLNEAMARAAAGEKLRADLPWVNVNVSKNDIFKMRVTIQDGRNSVATQQNDYFRDRLKQWQMTIADGKSLAKSLWNGMEK